MSTVMSLCYARTIRVRRIRSIVGRQKSFIYDIGNNNNNNPSTKQDRIEGGSFFWTEGGGDNRKRIRLAGDGAPRRGGSNVSGRNKM